MLLEGFSKDCSLCKFVASDDGDDDAFNHILQIGRERLVSEL